jgi:hypothetical protein
MAKLTDQKKKAIRRYEVVYQCILEDLVDLDVLPAEIADKLLEFCSGHVKSPPKRPPPLPEKAPKKAE